MRGWDRMQAEGESRDHAEIAAAAAHRPEQVGVLAPRRRVATARPR